ncbi:acetolactate synthase, partial [Ramicandelaber brevisporus]
MYRRGLTVATAAVFRAPAAQLKPSSANILASRFKSSYAGVTTEEAAAIERASHALAAKAASAYGRSIGHSARGPKSTLSCLMTDEPGVLARVAGVMAARGFNIDSLVVARTNVPSLSRTTIVMRGGPAVVEQVRRQLEDMVEVWAVLDYSSTSNVEREMALFKVSLRGSEAEQSQPAALDMGSTTVQDNLATVERLAKLFGARLGDISNDSVIVEFMATSDRIDELLALCKPMGIVEVARSGVMAMLRDPIAGLQTESEDDHVDAHSTTVDATMLPPG